MPKSSSKKKSQSTSSCKKGYIKRKAYTKKSGTRVKGECIKATSQSGLKRSDFEKKELEREKKIHSEARKKFGTPKCKSGEILREGYHKKKYTRKAKSSSKSKSKSSKKVKRIDVKSTWVAPTCIKSVTGRPHGKKLFTLEKGDLEKFGYDDVKNLTKSQRQSALKKALKKIKPLSLFRKINALYVLNENKDPKLAKIFKDDRDFIKTTPEYKNR